MQLRKNKNTEKKYRRIMGERGEFTDLQDNRLTD
jgi:hypothetical protein